MAQAWSIFACSWMVHGESFQRSSVFALPFQPKGVTCEGNLLSRDPTNRRGGISWRLDCWVPGPERAFFYSKRADFWLLAQQTG